MGKAGGEGSGELKSETGEEGTRVAWTAVRMHYLCSVAGAAQPAQPRTWVDEGAPGQGAQEVGHEGEVDAA